MSRPLILLTALSFLPSVSHAFGLESFIHPTATFMAHHHHHPEFLSIVQQQLHSVQRAYTESLHEHPLVTKMLTGGTLAASGDAIAQRKTGEPYDQRRAASFLTFDMAYRALQHAAFPYIVAHCHGLFLTELIPHSVDVPREYLAAMEQTFASQLGIVPFVYYPVFFTLTGFLQGLTPGASWNRAKENFGNLMKRNLVFWIPVQFIQFGFIEEQLQIPFLSAAGLCWTFTLSLIAGSTKSYHEPPQVQLEGDGVTNEGDIVTISGGEKAPAVAQV